MFNDLIEDDTNTILKVENPKPTATLVQPSVLRGQLISVRRGEHQIVGFQFINEIYKPVETGFCNKVIVSVCMPTPVFAPMKLTCAKFISTSDPCYEVLDILYIEEPNIDLQLDSNGFTTGVLVRFQPSDTEKLPIQQAFKLVVTDENNWTYSLASGLLTIN